MPNQHIQGMKPYNIKQANRQSIFYQFILHKERAVADITQALSLSRTSVVKVLGNLLEEGLIFSAGKGASTSEGGKRPELYRLNENALYSLSLRINQNDAVIEQRDLLSSPICKKTFSLSQPEQYHTVVQQLAQELRHFIAEFHIDLNKLTGIVIGSDGLSDPVAGIIRIPAHHHWGNQLHICRDLQEISGLSVPFYLGNVTKFAGYWQHRRFPQERIALLLIAGTSGCCITESAGNGSYMDSFSEMVHMIVEPHSREICPICGQRGCFESMVNPYRTVEQYCQRCEESSPLFPKKQDRSLTIKDIFDAADHDDPLAVELLQETSRYFATFFHNIMVTAHPDRIVIGEKYSAPGIYMTRLLQKEAESQFCSRYGHLFQLSFGASFDDFAAGAAYFATLQHFHMD